MKKKLFSIILFAFTFCNTNGQTENKDVIIITSGSGKTIEEAQQSALRSAIEQAFGVFISSKTEMFNDKIIADEMASVSSGNIKSFQILNQGQLPDGRWALTIKSTVSVDKLTSFVQAKGVEIEIKGGLYALNIKQQLLNEKSEIETIAEMIGLLHEPMQISFDYKIQSSQPKSLDNESKEWEFFLQVSAVCNKNLDFCANYFVNTLKAISLTTAEVQTYQSLNKKVYPLIVNYSNQSKVFYLRKEISVDAINSFLSNWEYYTRQFTVYCGLGKGIPQRKINEQFDIKNNKISLKPKYSNDKIQIIEFLSAGNIACEFTNTDTVTLSQLEQITGYIANAKGITSKFKFGGYVVWEKDNNALVVSLFDLGIDNYDNAKSLCEELSINGYSDWYLPTIEELNLIYNRMFCLKLGGFETQFFETMNYEYKTDIKDYWSSTENNQYAIQLVHALRTRFPDSDKYEKPKNYYANIRAVRKIGSLAEMPKSNSTNGISASLETTNKKSSKTNKANKSIYKAIWPSLISIVAIFLGSASE